MGNTDSISSVSSDCSLTRQLTPPRNQTKKPLRSFLRSVSSNSADSNQELLLMGEPRLSDIAPDLAFKHPVNAGKTNTKTIESLMYSALPTSEEDAADTLGDEVFISEDSAKYYNYSVVKPTGQRRHSMGTFMERERSSSVTSSLKSFKEDFPQGIIHATSDGDSVGASSIVNIDEHALRHGSYPRKRCSKCTRG